MSEPAGFPELLLVGGPLQKLGAWLGLARPGRRASWFGLSLGLLAWTVLAALAFYEGLAPRLFSLSAIGVHVRLLLVIPLFFACEGFVGPVIAEFARNLRESRLVPESEWPKLARIVRRTTALSAAWPVELLMGLLFFAGPVVGIISGRPGGTANWASLAGAAPSAPLTNGWYLIFCLPLFRFLTLRWLWRLGLWWFFLWKIRKLDLRLVATHSDRVGGLGFLGVVQEHFLPLVAAISLALSGSFAEAIRLGSFRFESLYVLVPGVIVGILALFIGPLVLFTRRLWECRVNGLDKYMAMASRYVQAFERRWVLDPDATGESQLGTGDLQSLADLTNSMDVISGIRLVPGGSRLTLWLTFCVIVPMLPLILLKYPISEVVRILLRALAGL